jgi:hypothetical protein
MAETKPAAQPARKKVTIPSLVEKMKRGEQIVQLAVYEYRQAVIADRLSFFSLQRSKRSKVYQVNHTTLKKVGGS